MCEDLLICDLAETYHVFNYRELSSFLVATLLLGLRNDSRVKMHLNKQKITLDQTMMALMVDSLNFLCWSKTKDASKGRNRPKKVIDILLEEPQEKDELMSFETPEEFEKWLESKRKE